MFPMLTNSVSTANWKAPEQSIKFISCKHLSATSNKLCPALHFPNNCHTLQNVLKSINLHHHLMYEFLN